MIKENQIGFYHKDYKMLIDYQNCDIYRSDRLQNFNIFLVIPFNVYGDERYEVLDPFGNLLLVSLEHEKYILIDISNAI
jgi:hypothetical protein